MSIPQRFVIVVPSPRRHEHLQKFLFAIGLTWRSGDTSPLYRGEKIYYLFTNFNYRFSCSSSLERGIECLEEKEIVLKMKL